MDDDDDEDVEDNKRKIPTLITSEGPPVIPPPPSLLLLSGKHPKRKSLKLSEITIPLPEVENIIYYFRLLINFLFHYSEKYSKFYILDYIAYSIYK